MRGATGLAVPLHAARLASAALKCEHRKHSAWTLLDSTKKTLLPKVEHARALRQFLPESSGRDARQVMLPHALVSRLELRNSLAEDNPRHTRARAVFLALGVRGLDILLVPRIAVVV